LSLQDIRLVLSVMWNTLLNWVLDIFTKTINFQTNLLNNLVVSVRQACCQQVDGGSGDSPCSLHLADHSLRQFGPLPRLPGHHLVLLYLSCLAEHQMAQWTWCSLLPWGTSTAEPAVTSAATAAVSVYVWCSSRMAQDILFPAVTPNKISKSEIFHQWNGISYKNILTSTWPYNP
jgi:hypothetical protein